MRDCPDAQIRDQLPDLVHDRLSAAARERVLAHVSRCGECAGERALLESLRRSHLAAHGAPRVDVARIVAVLPRPEPAMGADRLRLVPAGSQARTRAAGARMGRWGGWRAAAAIAAVSLGALAVEASRRDGVVGSGRDTVAVAASALTGASSAARPSARSVTGIGTSAAPAAGVTLGVPLSDVNESELQALLSEMESLETLTPTEPEMSAASLVEGVS